MSHNPYFYGDIFKLMGILVGVPFTVYLLQLGRRESSRPAIMHALGWLLFLAALTPGESWIFQRIFTSSHELFTFQRIVLSLSGLCMTVGVSAMVYPRNPKKLAYLGGLSLILILDPLYQFTGGLFFSGNSFELFKEVFHVVQYGYLLLLLGIMIRSSSRDRDFRRLGLLYTLMGVTLLVYPFAKAVSMTFRALDIFTGLMVGVAMLLHLSGIMKRRIELIIPERTVKMEALKKVSIVDKRKAGDILNNFKSFPVLAFVREPEYPKSWNVYVISTAPMENAISPTNLALINELCVQYMKKAKERGGSGIVYLNCLEYLKLYNPVMSLLKFLHALRDYAIIYNGTVIIEIDENAWEKREIILLREIEA